MSDDPAQPPPPSPAPTPVAPQAHWSAGRVFGVVISSIAGLVGIFILLVGVVVIAAYGFGRDDDGYFNTDRTELSGAGFAITTEEIDLAADELDWAPDDVLGKVRIQVEGNSRPVFVGIGTDQDVTRYLAGVARDELVGFDGDRPELVPYRGGAPPGSPGQKNLWVAEAEGPGEQALEWDAEFGRWTVVVMNADGARGVNVEADAGVKVGWVIWVGIGLFLIGLVMTIGAVVVVLLIGRRSSRMPPPAV